MPILSLESLPWILLACVVARSAWLGASLARARAESKLARELLASAEAALEEVGRRVEGDAAFHGNVTKHSPPRRSARTHRQRPGLHATLKDAD